MDTSQNKKSGAGSRNENLRRRKLHIQASIRCLFVIYYFRNSFRTSFRENKSNSEIPDFEVHKRYTEQLKHKIIAPKCGVYDTKIRQKPRVRRTRKESGNDSENGGNPCKRLSFDHAQCSLILIWYCACQTKNKVSSFRDPCHTEFYNQYGGGSIFVSYFIQCW